jgi:pilus assembly protein CpaB
MRTKTMLIALFVASIVVLAGILWRNGSQIQPIGATAAPVTTSVLVATAPLGTGTLLRAEDVHWQPWSDPVQPTYIVRPSEEARKAKPDIDAETLANVYGAVVRQRIEAGKPIAANMIVKPGDRGFLAAVLTPGYRAIAIGVTAVSGAAGLIFPGDHVDVILTQRFQDTQEPLARRSVGETIVQNLRVLAVDQHLQQVSADPSANGGQVARTVTLELLPEQAEMVSVAAELGKLSLTLRSVPIGPEPLTADNQVAETTRSTWADDVSPALRPQKPKPHAGAKAMVVRIMRGSKTENVKQD